MKAAILLLLLITSASGQIIIDPEGDVNTTILEDQQIPIGPQAFDLLQLDVFESRDTIDFTATIASFQRTTDIGFELFIGFQFEDTEFLSMIDFSSLPVGDVTIGTLYKRPAGGAEWVAQNITYTTVTDGTPATVKFSVDRNDIQNEIGFTPFKGDQLESFWMAITDKITRYQIVGGLPRLAPYIHFDDDAESNNVLQLKQGKEQRTGIQLQSPEPIRRTNGEGQTLIFNVTTTNFEAEDREIQFTVTDAPSDWEVTPLVPVLRIPTNTTVSTPVAVSIPFKHIHGDKETTTITILDLETEKILDSLDLGMYFLRTALPSGHHDTVWLHTIGESDPDATGQFRGTRTTPFLTTNQETGSDTKNPVQARSYDPIKPTMFYWCLPISPAMMIGLDLLDGAGETVIDFRSELPFSGTAEGRIMLHGDGQGYVEDSKCSRKPGKEIASFEIGQLNLERGVVVTKEISFETEASRTTPSTQLMVIEITYNVELSPAPIGYYPTIEHGMHMTLPLADYKDELPKFQSLSDAELDVLGDSRVKRNPGSVALFEFQLTGEGEYALELIGNQAGWASLPSSSVTEGSFFATVSIPNDAIIGSVLELVIQAQQDEELALAQFSVEVAEGDFPDDRETANEIVERARETPFPLGLAVAALGIAFASRKNQ